MRFDVHLNETVVGRSKICPIGRHRGCECRFVIYSVVHGMTVGFT